MQILYSPERNIIIFIVIKYHDIGLVNKISLRWTQYDQIIVFNIQGELIAVRQSHNLRSSWKHCTTILTQQCQNEF